MKPTLLSEGAGGNGRSAGRLRYVVAAILVLVAAVIFWLLFSARAPRRDAETESAKSRGAEAQQSLADDAAALSTKGIWQSEVLKIKLRDGTVTEQRLVIEFGASARAGQSNAPDAKAKLSTVTLPEGSSFANASSSLGDVNFRDVRLRETNGVRTITITRALETIDHPTKKTQRILERFYSVS